MSIELFLSVWGAALSTILGLLRIIEFAHDRPKIHIDFECGRAVYSSGLDYGEPPYVSITIANRGRRPITVGDVGLLLARGNKPPFIHHVDYLRPRGVPELNEGKSQSYFVKQSDVPNPALLQGKRRYVVCVIDATGKKYYSDGILFRLLKLKRLGA